MYHVITAATQAAFLETKLKPLLEKARAGKEHVFFVDAAHFVMGAFLCCVWCWVRLLIRGGSGRKRYSVLGAWNAVTMSITKTTTSSCAMTSIFLPFASYQLPERGRFPSLRFICSIKLVWCSGRSVYFYRVHIKMSWLARVRQLCHAADSNCQNAQL